MASSSPPCLAWRGRPPSSPAGASPPHLELIGVANVLSIHTNAPLAWQSCAMAATSTQRRYGLVGDSEKKRVTWWVVKRNGVGPER